MSTVGKEPYRTTQRSFTSFCDLFKFQVKDNPDATAAIFGEESLTYKELDHRSNQLANFLKANGVGRDTIVALSLQNSLNLLIGILGILRSGGAYLPIDPNYPDKRINMMLEDAKPHILLTDESLNNKFSAFPYKIALIDKVPISEPSNQEEDFQPDQLAYIVYTSGSTGRPKGIMLEHNALGYAISVNRQLHPAKFISLMTGSISFDASLLVITHTLASGGTICLSKSETFVDFEQISALIEKQGIDYSICVPSFYKLLLDRSHPLLSLKSIGLGGESMSSVIPKVHAKIAPNSALYNIYGPSEYSIGATYAKIYDPVTKKINKITIGKPYPGTQIYIFDENLKQVPLGCKGEIFIGGPGLARGYLNQESLSKEKFIWMTLHNQESIRLYRTGDLGRFLQDGNIELLGRIDHQVKIRGYRIELGEVEYNIGLFPGIQNAIVIAQESETLGKQLIVYFSSSEQISIEKLREYLKDILPDYMIPSRFFQVKAFSYTPNGKIDRNALVESTISTCKLKTLPKTEMERHLLKIWVQLLEHEAIGIDDNFFDLGGNSLLVGKMQNLLDKELQIDISLLDLFHYPTISQLAKYLSHKSFIAAHVALSHQQPIADMKKTSFQRLRKNTKNS